MYLDLGVQSGLVYDTVAHPFSFLGALNLTTNDTGSYLECLS